MLVPSLNEILLMLLPEKVGRVPDAGLNRMLADKILDFGAGIVLFKQGEKGIYMRTTDLANGRDLGRAFAGATGIWRHREIWAPAFKVSMIGTTGAGDCAVAGFLAAILRGMSPENALMVSSAVGACNVEAADATSGVRSWQDTLERINSGWQQHDLALPGWTFDKTTRLWFSPIDGEPT